MAKAANTVTISKLICHRCGADWYPRTPQMPKVCPVCKSRDYQTPREKK